MNFIYLKESRLLLNIESVITFGEKNGKSCQALISSDGSTLIELKESFDYIKDLVYEAQFKQEKE